MISDGGWHTCGIGTCETEVKTVHRVVIWKWDGTDDWEDLDSDGRIILKLDKGIRREGVELIHMGHVMDQLWAAVKMVMNICMKKFKRLEFFHSLTDCPVLLRRGEN